MRKTAVIIYGPPGAGKGTQAELVSKRLGLVHFDTGRYIEALVHSKEAGRDKVLKREQVNFDIGKLCTPSWVLKIIREATTRIAKAGQGIVFSGSPRTVFEAFGEPEEGSGSKPLAGGGLIKTLEKLYGKNNIVIIELRLPERESIKRNSRRVVCSVCGLPILAEAKAKSCALCGGKPRTRTLDNPEVIRVRLKEFARRTAPIIARLKSRKFSVCLIDGRPAPYRVFENILKKIKSLA